MGHDIFRELERLAARSKSRVGIGVGQNNPHLLRAVAKVRRFSDVVLVGNVGEAGRDVVQTSEPEQKLVEMLVDGTIDAAVRGTISARKTLQQLKEQTGAPQLCRSALLSTSDARQFFLLPVGIDEGTLLSERVHLVMKTAKLLSALSVAPTVGVLSGGRSEDKGRTKAIDLTLANAEALTKQLHSAGIDATNYNILIEDASKSSNILVAPDGVTGNLIFRTLIFLGGGKGHGAPFFGIPYTFVDTSRSGAAFGDAIIMAGALSNLAQG
ncbi:MAG: methanogenesis marker protein Mmp4/MtxX [Halobacteriota archaeon]